MYGKLRRSDFLPVGPELKSEHTERGYQSLDSDDEDGCGLEYAFPEGADSDANSEQQDFGDSANALNPVDFEVF